MIEKFKYISIRGRMAYLLCSFEIMLQHFECEKNEWEWFLDILWGFTNNEYIEDWVYKVVETLPETILGEDYDEKEFEYINIIQYKKLKSMYSIAPPIKS